MIDWGHPTALVAIPLLIALTVALGFAMRRRERAMEEFAEAKLLASLVSTVGTVPARVSLGLRLAALTLALVALAGPRWGFRWEEVRREGVDVIVAIDTSRSMLATDVQPSRIERAKLATLDLVERLEGDRIGLVAFAGSAFLECPLTIDRAIVRRSLHSIRVGTIPRGGTSLARAIETGIDAFESRQGRHQALILITDGESHEGDTQAAAVLAAERGIRIFTVGIGTPEGELVPGQQGFLKNQRGEVIKSRLDETTLQDTAIATGGVYVRSSGATLGLDEIFRDHIARMEKREIESSIERRYEEQFQIPLGIAFALLLFELLFSRRRSKAAPAIAAAIALVLAPTLAAAETDPLEAARLGEEAFVAGDFTTAIDRLREALIDRPDDPLLQYDLGVALYRAGKFDDAAQAFEKSLAFGGTPWSTRAAYNLGNAHVRAADVLAEAAPHEGLTRYQAALLAYRKALFADPNRPDARFNHEVTAQKIAALRKKIEEQEQEQKQENEEEEPPPQEPSEDEQEQEQEQEQPDETPEEEPQSSEDGQPENSPPQDPMSTEDEPEPSEGEGPPDAEPEEPGESDGEPGESDSPPEAAPQDAGEAGQEAGDANDSSDAAAAQAILDMARGEELGPDDVRRDRGVAGLGSPSRNW